ncbi:phospholipase [Asticcacaulis sp.]|uniref:carboxylesterase family protein n=1 Tax=Asticcacaulis sp. TaxID=1872648 RepID=UPI0026368661|nr:phospholipase [Asticcacaulis sp.]
MIFTWFPSKALIAFFALFWLTACASLPSADLPRGETPKSLMLKDGRTIGYMQSLPSNLSGKAPVLVFLHGTGEIGTDVKLTTVHGPWAYSRANPDKAPFIILAPQLSEKVEWNPATLDEWLTQALKGLPADHSRLYLTGLSRGGRGTWNWAIAYPRRFAAIAPVSGDSLYRDGACALKDVPVWAFHGAKDDIVLYQPEDQFADAVRACGGEVNYTLYPDGNHNAWDAAYATPSLYAWLLTHKR